MIHACWGRKGVFPFQNSSGCERGNGQQTRHALYLQGAHSFVKTKSAIIKSKYLIINHDGVIEENKRVR